jgi:hypothetical protein
MGESMLLLLRAILYGAGVAFGGYVVKLIIKWIRRTPRGPRRRHA